MGKLVSIFVCTIALCSCVRTHSDMLDERTLVISGRGTAFDTTGDVMKAVLTEAALKAKAAGYQFFKITDSQDESSQGVMVVPGQTQTTGTASATCAWGACNGSYSGTSTTAPTTAFGIRKPGVSIYVHFYRTGEVDPDTRGVWSVASVLAVAK